MKALTFLLTALVVIGGFFVAKELGYLPAIEQPVADSLWEVAILASSSVDRTTVSESILDNSHTIVWVLSDANMDGLSDANIDVRIINRNVGSPERAHVLFSQLTFEDGTFASGNPSRQPIINRTSLNEIPAITWSWTESGNGFTGSAVGSSFTTHDGREGGSDVCNIDVELSPTALDDLGASAKAELHFSIGGTPIRVVFQES